MGRHEDKFLRACKCLWRFNILVSLWNIRLFFFFWRSHWNVRMRMLNNTTKLLNQKQISTQHLLFHRSAVVLSLENGAYPQNMPRVFCHNDSVLLNLLRVWILRKVFPLKICACLCCLIKIAFFFFFINVCVLLPSNAEPCSLNHESSGRVQTREKQEECAV